MLRQSRSSGLEIVADPGDHTCAISHVRIIGWMRMPGVKSLTGTKWVISNVVCQTVVMRLVFEWMLVEIGDT